MFSDGALVMSRESSSSKGAVSLRVLPDFGTVQSFVGQGRWQDLFRGRGCLLDTGMGSLRFLRVLQGPEA